MSLNALTGETTTHTHTKKQTDTKGTATLEVAWMTRTADEGENVTEQQRPSRSLHFFFPPTTTELNIKASPTGSGP